MIRDNTPIFVGIDGGGTKCRAVVFDNDYNELSSALAGPANVAKSGSLAYDAICAATDKALHAINVDMRAHTHRLFVSAGLAGVNVPSAQLALANWQHPFARFDFTTDIHSALLGAHNGNNGAVLIAGTGSCAASLSNQVVTQFGGHGFTLGDKGSGAWLGRLALCKALESLDNVIFATDFTVQVLKQISARSASDIVNAFNQASPKEFGALAPLVIDAAHKHDPVALAIVEDGAKYLSTIAANALAISDHSLVLVGGVSQAIRPWLNTALMQSVVTAKYGPEHGAVIYQRAML